jgi:UDP-N-acetyl-D-mannosaminuronate dehydrogenase
MNANDWDAKENAEARPDARYHYPGASIGGPVLIPGTDFNKNKEAAVLCSV